MKPRIVAGYAAVAAALPYLSLKIAWLSGATIGFADPAFAHSPGLYALNALTAGLDLAAILVALAFTHRWGQRVPAWLVLLPTWVGTGLLAPIAVIGPFAAGYTLLSGNAVVPVDGPVRPWVYAMVYTGFVCEGLALATAFVLYARQRWPLAFSSRVTDAEPGATSGLQAVIGRGAAVLAGLLGAAHLAWALGITAGQPDGRGVTAHVIDGVYGVLALAAAAGVLALVGRPARGGRLWAPVTLVWAGSGSMFAWGAWGMVIVLSGSVIGGDKTGLAAVNLVAFGKVVAGVLIGTVAAFALAERHAARV
jgi:hypothetical protein